MGNWLIGANDPRDPVTGLHNLSADTLQPRSLSQAGSDVGDFGRVAANTFGLGDRATAGVKTYGWMDYLLPGLTGTAAQQSRPSADYDKALADARANTAAASQRIGPVASAAANMVGYGPFGAAARGVGLGTGVLGTAAEGLTAGGLTAAGHGDNVGLGMLEGGVGGAGVGAATKYLVNPIATAGANWLGKTTGALPDPADITAALKSDRDGKYEALKDVFTIRLMCS